MATFTPLDCQVQPDGISVILLSPFTATLDDGRVFVVPKGFISDFASTPTVLQSLFPRMDNYTEAAVLHDYLYSTHVVTRADADAIFLELAKDLGTPWYQRYPMYLGLRAFGWSHW